jgi:hypothetical protein
MCHTGRLEGGLPGRRAAPRHAKETCE